MLDSEINSVISKLDKNLSVMKGAQKTNTNMCIWQTDIDAVQNAINFLRKVRENG